MTAWPSRAGRKEIHMTMMPYPVLLALTAKGVANPAKSARWVRPHSIHHLMLSVSAVCVLLDGDSMLQPTSVPSATLEATHLVAQMPHAFSVKAGKSVLQGPPAVMTALMSLFLLPLMTSY